MYTTPFRRLAGPASCALVALAAACAGSDPLAAPDTGAPIRAAEDEASLALLATTTRVGGTNPALAAMPKALDTVAVGDSIQYVPRGTLVRSDVRRFWYSTNQGQVSVSQSGWIRGLAAGSAVIVMVPQAQPFPAAFTHVTVVERPVAPPPAPVTEVIGVVPELPRSVPSTAMPAQTGRTISVPAGGNLQAALDAAQPGDVVALAPGATYTGAFRLPVKSGSGWIVVRTAVPDAQLPAPGTRLTPARAQAANLARIVSSGRGAPALQTAPGAARWRLMGLEVTAQEGATIYHLVGLGTAGAAQDTEAEIPRDFVLDRVWIHGTPTLNFQRCLLLNSANTAVVDSYLSDCHGRGIDAQAIIGWNGPGPYLIQNNYLEGSGMNVMFGGAAPNITNLIPSDITIRGNYMRKPRSWKGVWTVKNILETKSAMRLLIEENVMEGSWTDGQTGFALMFKSSNENQASPWSTTRDVTVRKNVVRDVGAGIAIGGTDNYRGGIDVPTHRIRISDNLFERVNVPGSEFIGAGRLIQTGSVTSAGPADLAFVSNTFGATGSVSPWGDGINIFLQLNGPNVSGLVIARNVVSAGQYNVIGDRGLGWGTGALAGQAPGYVFEQNLLVGSTNRDAYRLTSTIFTDSPIATWQNPATGDWTLRANESWRGIGAPIATLRSMETMVIDGVR